MVALKSNLSLSVMCADKNELEAVIDTVEKMNIEYLHLDFMDGKFVPNEVFSADTIKGFSQRIKNTRRDIHIMAFEPQQYFNAMDIHKGDMVSVHYEACSDVKATLDDIKNRGAYACLAINPKTDVCVIKRFLPFITAVLIMTVEPGFAGQPLAENSFERIRQARYIVNSSEYKDVKIEVDGNVSWKNSVKMKEAGADIFVAGSSSVFDNKNSVEKNITLFLNRLGEHNET